MRLRTVPPSHHSLVRRTSFASWQPCCLWVRRCSLPAGLLSAAARRGRLAEPPVDSAYAWHCGWETMHSWPMGYPTAVRSLSAASASPAAGAASPSPGPSRIRHPRPLQPPIHSMASDARAVDSCCPVATSAMAVRRRGTCWREIACAAGFGRLRGEFVRSRTRARLHRL